jgi:hypothetical protein
MLRYIHDGIPYEVIANRVVVNLDDINRYIPPRKRKIYGRDGSMLHDRLYLLRREFYDPDEPVEPVWDQPVVETKYLKEAEARAIALARRGKRRDDRVLQQVPFVLRKELYDPATYVFEEWNPPVMDEQYLLDAERRAMELVAHKALEGGDEHEHDQVGDERTGPWSLPGSANDQTGCSHAERAHGNDPAMDCDRDAACAPGRQNVHDPRGDRPDMDPAAREDRATRTGTAGTADDPGSDPRAVGKTSGGNDPSGPGNSGDHAVEFPVVQPEQAG